MLYQLSHVRISPAPAEPRTPARTGVRSETLADPAGPANSPRSPFPGMPRRGVRKPPGHAVGDLLRRTDGGVLLRFSGNGLSGAHDLSMAGGQFGRRRSVVGVAALE